jgi:hypothetical protein
MIHKTQAAYEIHDSIVSLAHGASQSGEHRRCLQMVH